LRINCALLECLWPIASLRAHCWSRPNCESEAEFSITAWNACPRLGAVAKAKKLYRVSPETGKRMSLRKISAELAEARHLNERGRPFNQRSIKAMLDG